MLPIHRHFLLIIHWYVHLLHALTVRTQIILICQSNFTFFFPVVYKILGDHLLESERQEDPLLVPGKVILSCFADLLLR